MRITSPSKFVVKLGGIDFTKTGARLSMGPPVGEPRFAQFTRVSAILTITTINVATRLLLK